LSPGLTAKLGGLLPTREDWRRSFGALWRGSALGFFVGVLPGASASVAAFIAYDVEKKVSREPERFGRGAIEGVAAPEGANNSAVAGGMVPLLTLGLPPSAPLAVLLSSLMLHGVRPGPLFFQQHADVAWALIASMYVGNAMLLVLNLPLVGLWAQLARVPYPILAPAILVFCFVGAYGIRNTMFDVWVALAAGLVGYVMRKLEFPTVPLVIALILSPMLEAALRQSLAISKGDPAVFVSRPIALGLLAAAGASLALGLWGRRRRPGAAAVLAGETE
jgi:putative tricarboxylic transport membrane protein